VAASVTGTDMTVRGSASDGHQGLAVLGLVVGAQFPPVKRRDSGLGRRRHSERGIRIDDKLAIMRMALAKLIADRNVATATGEDGGQHRHQQLDLCTEQLPTNPDGKFFDSTHDSGLPHFLWRRKPMPHRMGGDNPLLHKTQRSQGLDRPKNRELLTLRPKR